MRTNWFGKTRDWIEGGRINFWRTLIITAALGLTLFVSVVPSLLPLPPTISMFIPLAVAALIIGIGGVLLLMQYPIIGLIGIVIASLNVPFVLGVGGESGLNAGVLVLCLMLALWVVEMWRRREIALFASRTTLPMILFSVVAVVAFLMGMQPWKPNAPTAPMGAQVAGLLIILLSVGAFLLIANQVKDIKWLKWIVGVFLFLVTLVSIGRLEPRLGAYLTSIVVSRATGSVFWIWGMALSFSMALVNKKLSWFWRAVCLGIFLLIFYVRIIIGQAWTSGWLPGSIAVAVILWLASPKLGLLATIAAGVVALFDFQSIYNLLLVGDNAYSLDTRIAAWRILIEIIRINPMLGLGPSNYYYNTPLFSILGWTVQFNSHNNLVDITAQMGLIGLFIYFWIFYEIARIGLKLRSTLDEGFEKAYVYAVLGAVAGSLVASMLGDWVIPFYYNVGMEGFRGSLIGWMFFGGLVAIERLQKSREITPPTGMISTK